MITFKDANGSISSSEEGTDSPCHDLAVETHKLFPLDTHNQRLMRSKELDVFM